MTNKYKSAIYYLAIALALAAGIYLRGSNLASRGLEYDEIWTFFHYASQSVHKIFTDLGTPNNHPLHSLAVKISMGIMGANAFAFRFFPFVFGASLIAVINCIAFQLFKSRTAAILAAVFCAANGALIHFSQTSRGYEMQSFFVAAFLLCILLTENKNSKAFERITAIIALPLTGVAAMLTLSPSVLFIVPLAGLHVFWKISQTQQGRLSERARHFLRNNMGIVISYCALAIFCMLWYGLNYSKFTAGKNNFGTTPESAAHFLSTISHILNRLVWLPLLIAPFAFLARKKTHKYLAAFLILILFPFALAPLTRFGPPRVYLPLIPFACVAASGGLIAFRNAIRKQRALKYIPIALAVVMAMGSLYRAPKEVAEWTPIDWKIMYGTIKRSFPREAYICYSAPTTYPILHNNYPQAKIDNIKKTPRIESLFVTINMPEGITGLSILDYNIKTLKIRTNKKMPECKIGNVSFKTYKLKKASPNNLRESNIVIASIQPTKMRTAINYNRFFKETGNWFMLNMFLTPGVMDKNFPLKSYVLASDLCPFTFEEMSKIEKNTSGGIKFFCLSSI